MILLVDVGNTNIVFGFSDLNKVKKTFRFKTLKDKTSDEYYILKPDNIPMANCNESLYIIQNGNECGLCKDLDKNNQYKLINEKTCLDKKPENTYYVYKELKILNYCML